MNFRPPHYRSGDKMTMGLITFSGYIKTLELLRSTTLSRIVLTRNVDSFAEDEFYYVYRRHCDFAVQRPRHSSARTHIIRVLEGIARGRRIA